MVLESSDSEDCVEGNHCLEIVDLPVTAKVNKSLVNMWVRVNGAYVCVDAEPSDKRHSLHLSLNLVLYG